MNDKMLAYCLRETEVALRSMAKTGSPLHCFNYGTTPTGEKYTFVLAILPHEIANKFFAVDSWIAVPADASEPAQEASPEVKKSGFPGSELL